MGPQERWDQSSSRRLGKGRLGVRRSPAASLKGWRPCSTDRRGGQAWGGQLTR